MRVVVLLALVWFSTGAGCQRPCNDEQNCKRTCDCTDTNTGDGQECTMAFQCEKPDENANQKVCEEAYDNMSCDEMCTQFAKKGLCGSKRCDADADCDRRMLCDVLDANGNPTGLQNECRIPFVCDAGDQVCPLAFARTDQQLCLTCCTQPGVPCQ